MNDKPNKAVSKGTSDEATLDNALGLDLHYRQVTLAMQEGAGRIKGAGKMSYGVFLKWVQKKLE